MQAKEYIGKTALFLNHTAALVLLIFLFTANSAQATRPSDNAAGFPGVARAWRNVWLGFAQGGVIGEVRVQRGAAVKRGELLAAEHHEREDFAVRAAALKAKSTLQVAAGKAQLAYDQVVLAEKEFGYRKHAVTNFELQQAKLKVIMDQLSLQLARLKHQADQLALGQARQALIDREILAPFDGVIDDRRGRIGMPVQPAQKVIQLVQVDPLRVMATVALDAARRLRVGQTGTVTLASGGRLTGTVRWIAEVADPSSATVQVELRVPNPRHLPAGQEVTVNFNDP